MTLKPSALLWDNDGVLVDTEALYFQANREQLAGIGATLTEALYVEYFLRTGSGAWHLAQELGVSEEQIRALKLARNARYSELLTQGDVTVPSARDVVSTLARHYRMAIVTSSEADHFQVIHRATEILPHFEFVLTRGDYQRSKPDPEPYLCALSRLGLTADQCLVIEDSGRGLRAATAAGIRCWMVRSRFTRDEAFPEAERIFEDLPQLAAALMHETVR